MTRPQICVRNLHYVYRAPNGEIWPALRGVDLEIEAGEYNAIIGANGSGKSTLVRHFNALLLPEKGDVWVEGRNTRDVTAHPFIRQSVGMVFQFPEDQIVASVVEEDVAFGLENLGLAESEIRQRVAEMLQVLGLWEHRQRPSHLLSAGQIQRLALAGVLVVRPRCLVLDEATTMLDPQGRMRLLDLVEALNREGITLIHVTHHMDEAARAQRVIVMHHGRIVLDGSPETVFANSDHLESLGLEIPPTLRLAKRLHLIYAGFPARALQPEDLLNNIPPFPGDAKGNSINVSENARKVESTLIEVKGLGHTYLQGTPMAHVALQDVDLQVGEGEAVALMGATGSGKSTLLQHLNGLLLPQKGEVRVGPFTLPANLDLRHVRQYAGLLMQNPEVQFFETYVGDEVAFAPRQMGVKDLRERVRWALGMVGLDFDTYKDRPLFTLSGGERRKVALASVLAMQPKVLLLDEPTAGLDPASRRGLLLSLNQLRANGVTHVIATHHLDDLLPLIDRVEILVKGTHWAGGLPQQVVANGLALQTSGLVTPLLFHVILSLRQKGWPVPWVNHEAQLIMAVQMALGVGS
ncbi:energy-coupling factor transporter ATPase [Thermanaerothrix sp. 4228-RoL]|uniref:Energy-coupling factor transporter ATPase n=1 Tax=Thermanaerothrix solaris TaxID=3058434 RepID=A0ABU3NS44_9CHLR|nr:energy-coupling factor transporter ATPase [Thermanaerothrix sp. 4228-RoL]MDT8899215.1 energy-coupling factor transporter ATPase [Thermanaerothrix sp. 4228-RoL]